MGRLFLCLVVAWYLVALLVAPVHGRVVPGLAGEVGGDQRSAPATSFDQVAKPKQQSGVKGNRASWSWSPTSRSPPRRGASAGAEAELRSVPGGPDPMHHHGSPRRPEQDRIVP